MNANGIVIGIDGGGTHTRAMTVDFAGNVLSYVEKGAASLYKDLHAKQNVHQAIQEAITAAGKTFGDVRGIAAGIAGYDSPEDLEWIEPLTAIDGLETANRWHLNDAAVAHYGALEANPGIVIISGTGSIIFAITEEGRQLRNYDFHHYAASAARFIAYDTTYELLAGKADATDEALVQSLLQHWQVASLKQLHELGTAGFIAEKRERNRKFGDFAPFVTKAASQGSRTARRVLDRAIEQIQVGVEMLAATFKGEHVDVAFIGSVINSEYVRQQLSQRLSNLGSNKSYCVVTPTFSPVAGAALYALQQLGTPSSPAIVHNLQQSIHARFHS
ncbi:N-acetylglucosamine kinase [Paenibacillus radicis (ex Gao et al. 2016)]|uniref:N-acetylmuramic acid/N-acetylglucosamine kinase n=1 Tax=Paenibacillus radicis (ex Gao et al. 2016) TaxID=1737354 RepID=A0A917HB13_9BACL|nr:BadF/BadG/BcrA/BcrD ATPase family protein [Paenibacillus radicis (ex Gao et al. 2016)]GGG72935.1 N-acetylmuramic acid/N-acetylglucosamine kinase [Paenibacillus radicis (ex Gao et al. 2016)]